MTLPINEKIIDVKFSNKHFEFFLNRCSIQIILLIEFLLMIGSEIIGKEHSNVIESSHLETNIEIVN